LQSYEIKLGWENLSSLRFIKMSIKKYACLSLSGGMDSSTLLLHLLTRGYAVTAISFDYSQKHKFELEKARELIEYLKSKSYKITHKIIKIRGLAELLNSTLIEGGNEVPEGHYAECNMQATVVPNRNKIFLSITQAVALSAANKNNTTAVIAMGIHAGVHAIYPDCRQEFCDIDYQAYLMGNWNAEKVTYYMPYIHMDKLSILKDGLECCRELNLNFDEVYKKTLTSYKPSKEGYSDYKSGSFTERIEAFIKLGKVDPLIYADENGIQPWEYIEYYVKKVLNNYYSDIKHVK